MAQEMPPSQPSAEAPQGACSWRERATAAADDLQARARELIDEGNQRRLVIQHEGRDVVRLPLTVAALIGGVTVVFAPVAAVIGAVAALMARVHARVEKE